MSKGLSRIWAAMFQLALTLVLGWMFAERLAQRLGVIQSQLHRHLHYVW